MYAAIEYVVRLVVGREHAMIGGAAEDGVADIADAAVLDDAANRIAAARAADQCHAGRAGAALQFRQMAAASSRRWSSVEERPACSTLSSLRASGSVTNL